MTTGVGGVGGGVALLLAAALASAPVPAAASAPVPAAAAAPGQPRAVSARGAYAPDEQSLIELFERARESVVHIATRQQVRDPWSRNVFSVPSGTGSGFVWDEVPHVVTNLHVVQGASEAVVRLADGRELPATLVGASPAHDLAVLRLELDADRPPPLPLGSSHDLKVGQKVVAIGNPFGLDWTLTTGIVSALDRSLPSGSGPTIEHLIQTDAAINPGNSGGPLLDSAGRLIGVNTAIYSPSGGSAGIGFAVPVDTVNRVVPQLIRDGRYLPPSIGAEFDEGLNRRLVRALGVDGVYVLRVQPGSPADRAGLRGLKRRADGRWQPGDVIVAIEGRKVSGVGQLLGRLDEVRVGERVRLQVLRDGRTLELAVAVRRAP